MTGIPAVREWRLVVSGPPRTKKTSNRIFQVGRKCPVCHKGTAKVMPSEAWTNWAASASVSRLMPLPWRTPTGSVNVAALFYRDANIGDATGYYQGLADLLEARGVLANDRQAVTWDGSRLLIDRVRPRVEVVLTAVVDDPLRDTVAA